MEKYVDVPEDGNAFAQFDYQMNHDLAFASNNNVYVLLMNGFKSMYSRIGAYYFAKPKARELATQLYKDLIRIAKAGDSSQAPGLIRQYGIESGKIWLEIRDDLPADIVD